MPEEEVMHQTSMQQYANEKIRNARRMAEIEREIDKAFRGSKDDISVIESLLTTLRGWLLKIAAMRPVKKEEAVNPIKS